MHVQKSAVALDEWEGVRLQRSDPPASSFRWNTRRSIPVLVAMDFTSSMVDKISTLMQRFVRSSTRTISLVCLSALLSRMCSQLTLVSVHLSFADLSPVPCPLSLIPWSLSSFAWLLCPQPIKLRPLEENPDPSPAVGLGKMPTPAWLSTPHSFMTQWLDVCLYCGCAGWGQQNLLGLVNNPASSGNYCNADPALDSSSSGNNNFSANLVGVHSIEQDLGKEGGAGELMAVDDVDEGRQQEEEHALQLQMHTSRQTSPRLFCADCGECFHSWCTAAPVRTMDLKAAAAWRCPNCKVFGCRFPHGAVLYSIWPQNLLDVRPSV